MPAQLGWFDTFYSFESLFIVFHTTELGDFLLLNPLPKNDPLSMGMYHALDFFQTISHSWHALEFLSNTHFFHALDFCHLNILPCTRNLKIFTINLLFSVCDNSSQPVATSGGKVVTNRVK